MVVHNMPCEGPGSCNYHFSGWVV